MEDAPRAGLERNRAVLEARQHTLPTALVFDRFSKHDLDLLSLKSEVVLRFEQLPFHARRADFERVMAWYDVLNVQNRPYLLGNQLTIGVRNSFRFID